MPNLSVSPIDLTTTLRRVPKTGSPSSQDYNDANTEILNDLSSLASLINNTLIPILNTLPAGASEGLAGDVINSSSDTESTLFFSTTANRFLTVEEILTQLNTSNNSLGTQLSDLAAQVLTLRSQLATTNQNDLIFTIQGFSTQLSAVVNNQSGIQSTLSQNTSVLAGFQTKRVSSTLSPGSTATLTVTWPITFTSNNYTANITLEDPSSYLQLVSTTRLANGVGFSVIVKNNNLTDTLTASIQCIAKAD